MRAIEREIVRYARRPRCRRCRRVYDPAEEGATLLKKSCFGCEWSWLERRLGRLADRIGRKAALQAIRRVTR